LLRDKPDCAFAIRCVHRYILTEEEKSGKRFVCGRLSFLPPPEGWWVSRKDFYEMNVLNNPNNLWMFPEDADHALFHQRVDAGLRLAKLPAIEQANYNTAYEVRYSELSEPQKRIVEKVAHELGWPTQRAGEDYKR
jgi:hypothetical protein